MTDIKKLFSEREQKIIKIIARKKMTLEQISFLVFEQEDRPFDSTISVANTIRRIIKKCSHYSLDWTLIKTRANNKLIIQKGKK